MHMHTHISTPTCVDVCVRRRIATSAGLYAKRSETFYSTSFFYEALGALKLVFAYNAYKPPPQQSLPNIFNRVLSPLYSLSSSHAVSVSLSFNQPLLFLSLATAPKLFLVC